jgi:GntR family transcriptional regulator of vanillate catabolism
MRCIVINPLWRFRPLLAPLMVVTLEESGSQAVKAQLKLRELILAGTLPAGARIAELTLVELLGVSRTPIRAALIRLEQEGLLAALPNGGYAVRTFSETDVSDAIELRGTIEGLAVRLAAERGASRKVLAQSSACLDEIDAVLADTALSDETFSAYVVLNHKFHSLLGALAGSDVLSRELDRLSSQPFASPSGFVGVQSNTPQARDMLIVAQHQHRQVLTAIALREGARAEALMREHSRLAQTNLREAMRSPQASAMPGVQLIRQRG